MRRHVATFVAAALLLSIAGPAFAGHPAPVASPAQTIATAPAAARAASTADPTGRWIVVYKSGTDVGATASARLAKAAGSRADRTFTNAFRGFSAKLDRGQVDALRQDPSVAAVVPDERIELRTAQLIPTGIGRIGGRALAGREDRRRRRARRRRRRDRRHRDRQGRRPQRRRRLQLLDLEPRRSGATSTATGRTSRARSARSTTASASSASRRASGCGP